MVARSILGFGRLFKARLIVPVPASAIKLLFRWAVWQQRFILTEIDP
jgi:hypothetical protein